MSAARPRSRLVKLIFFIASTIGRASKLLMSICSTTFESSSALRVSLILVGSFIALGLHTAPRPTEGWGPCGLRMDASFRWHDVDKWTQAGLPKATQLASVYS